MRFALVAQILRSLAGNMSQKLWSFLGFFMHVVLSASVGVHLQTPHVSAKAAFESSRFRSARTHLRIHLAQPQSSEIFPTLTNGMVAEMMKGAEKAPVEFWLSVTAMATHMRLRRENVYPRSLGAKHSYQTCSSDGTAVGGLWVSRALEKFRPGLLRRKQKLQFLMLWCRRCGYRCQITVLISRRNPPGIYLDSFQYSLPWMLSLADPSALLVRSLHAQVSTGVLVLRLVPITSPV